MQRHIMNWRTGTVIWAGEAATVKDAIQAALASGADLTGAILTGADLTGADLMGAILTGANLRGAILTGANLRGATLTGADLTNATLRGANLTGANLTGADLTGADLTGAILMGANLRGADLTGAILRGANLRGADLTDATLRGADLRGANLRDANLAPIRDDVWAVLSAAPREAVAVVDALRSGQVDGSAYEGECACLVGTIAKARHCAYSEIPTLRPNSTRLAEVWFLGIKPGDTPETSERVRITVEWAEQWLANMRDAFGPVSA
jgi:hypothetical protein